MQVIPQWQNSNSVWYPFRSHFGWNVFRTVGYLRCQLKTTFCPAVHYKWWQNVEPSLGSWNKQEFMHRKHANSLPPRKFHTHSAVGWKSHGHNFLGLPVDYPLHKTTMTGPYYRELLKKLRHAVKEKRRGMLTRCPLLLHDNAPAHMSQVSRAVVKDIGVEQLSCPHYSTDLALSDLYLFQHLKKHLRRKLFCDDDEFKQATESYLDIMPQEFNLTGIREHFDQFK